MWRVRPSKVLVQPASSGSEFVVASKDGSIKLWNAENLELVNTLVPAGSSEDQRIFNGVCSNMVESEGRGIVVTCSSGGGGNPKVSAYCVANGELLCDTQMDGSAIDLMGG